jgi:hypothetical protein
MLLNLVRIGNTLLKKERGANAVRHPIGLYNYMGTISIAYPVFFL